MLTTLVLTLTILACLALLAIIQPIANSVIRGSSTTIRWGIKSSAVNQQSGMAGAIVTRVAHEPLGGAPTYIEDDAGFAAIMVILLDGDKLTLTVIDDDALVFPQRGDWCSFRVPGRTATNSNFICVDNNAQLARKEPGTRTLVVEYHSNITHVASIPAA